MKSVVKLATVAVIIVLVAWVWLGSSFAATGSNASSASESRALFVSNCARCHGAVGNADTESAQLYDVPVISGGRLRRKSNTRLTAIVARGKGSMPAFGKKLTKAQIASLVAYVKKL
jgi:mono/diheme cytochrome c family protein